MEDEHDQTGSSINEHDSESSEMSKASDSRNKCYRKTFRKRFFSTSDESDDDDSEMIEKIVGNESDDSNLRSKRSKKNFGSSGEYYSQSEADDEDISQKSNNRGEIEESDKKTSPENVQEQEKVEKPTSSENANNMTNQKNDRAEGEAEESFKNIAHILKSCHPSLIEFLPRFKRAFVINESIGLLKEGDIAEIFSKEVGLRPIFWKAMTIFLKGNHTQNNSSNQRGTQDVTSKTVAQDSPNKTTTALIPFSHWKRQVRFYHLFSIGNSLWLTTLVFSYDKKKSHTH